MREEKKSRWGKDHRRSGAEIHSRMRGRENIVQEENNPDSFSCFSQTPFLLF
jgi:hypothetical protein